MHTNSTANTNLPDVSQTKAERRENAVTITLDQVEANIAESVARQQQLAALEAPAYPVEDEPAPLTLRQRWDAWWRNRRIASFRKMLAATEDRRDGLAERANKAKHGAQLDYTVRLQQIDSWRDTEAAKCKAEIAVMKAKLELLEAEQCA